MSFVNWSTIITITNVSQLRKLVWKFLWTIVPKLQKSANPEKWLVATWAKVRSKEIGFYSVGSHRLRRSQKHGNGENKFQFFQKFIFFRLLQILSFSTYYLDCFNSKSIKNIYRFLLINKLPEDKQSAMRLFLIAISNNNLNGISNLK